MLIVEASAETLTTLGTLAQRHPQIERGRRIDKQIDAGTRNRGKTGLFRGDGVGSGSQLQELIFTDRTCQRLTAKACLRVG